MSSKNRPKRVSTPSIGRSDPLIDQLLPNLKQLQEKNAKAADEDSLVKLLGNLSADERKMLEQSFKGARRKPITHDHTFSTKSIRFGYFSDPHIGNKAFNRPLWSNMAAYFKEKRIAVAYSPGDIVDGMSGRPGHIYELSAIGFTAQTNLAAELIGALPVEVYAIEGNHDLFFKDKSGVDASVGRTIESLCKNYHHLGEWEADIVLAKGVTMRLFHANDGTAYALSYKIQKLIESLEGGKKPSLILSGHYHKQIQVFLRNVWGFECGTLCAQTQWMRGKKIAAHQGFGILELFVADGRIERLIHEFVPWYS